MRRIFPLAWLFSLVMAVVITAVPPVRAAPSQDRNNASNRHELRDLQQFMHDHPWIANKLRQKPSLANDQGFLHDNAELSQFLNAHPFIQSSFRVNPQALLQEEQAFESSPASEDDERGKERQEMREFQRFLTNHPWIANKLHQDPSLANDQGFLRANHELPDFLKDHPFVHEQFRLDPQQFMQRTKEFASRESRGGNHAVDLAQLNQFMANHPWIAKKIQQDPQLANDGGFLGDNHELKAFLAAHAYLQQQFREDPHGLMDRARDYARDNSM